MINNDNQEFEINFLKELCKIAEGNTFLDIDIFTVSQNLDLEIHANDYPPEILVNTIDSLLQKNFIIHGNGYGKIRVTWHGIYNIINLPGEICTNYGVISKKEIEEFFPHFVDVLKNISENKGEIISVQEVKEKIKNYGSGPVYQFLEFLRLRGIVNFLEEDTLTTIKFIKNI